MINKLLDVVLCSCNITSIKPKKIIKFDKIFVFEKDLSFIVSHRNKIARISTNPNIIACVFANRNSGIEYKIGFSLLFEYKIAVINIRGGIKE
ncbi:TPA: hypothetical protein IAA87_04390 [Candidatus Avigastranaerophilus faecigallinarum]|nr:hypothetical protein [Candidatus Avigastranaerophilus faecigallinarum]